METWGPFYKGYWTFGDFYEHQQGIAIPHGPGVYTVYACQRDVSGIRYVRLIYLGETGTLRTRIHEHVEDQKRWERHLEPWEELCFAAAEFNTTGTVRKWIEAALINRHKPPENKEHVNSFDYPDVKIVTAGANQCLCESFTVHNTSRRDAR